MPSGFEADQIAQAGGAQASINGAELDANLVQVTATNASPTATDDVSSFYQVGHVWKNTSTGVWYRCETNTATAATWNQIYPPVVPGISMPVIAKTGAYSVAAGDAGYMIDCTSGTFTVTLLAAATAGDGFLLAVRNSGTGLITVSDGGTTITEGVPPGSTIFLTCDGSAYKVISHSPRRPVIHVREEQTSATAGGGSAAGWNTRVLNTVVENSIPGSSLATNQVTLPAGRYRVRHASAPAHRSDAHKIRLYNVTDTLTEAVGQSAWNNSASPYAQTIAVLYDGEFVLAASKVLELQHYIGTAHATNGLGIPTASGEVEVYSELIIEKVG